MGKKERKVMICPLCNREVPHISDHHLTPRSRGGIITLPICLDCHKELEDEYHTVDALLGNEKFAKHMKWLSKQDSNRRYKTKRYGVLSAHTIAPLFKSVVANGFIIVADKRRRGRSG